MNTSNPFFLETITDYWDYGAVDYWASLLDEMDDEERTVSEAELIAAVTEHAKVLSDKPLQLAAIAVADDLYKTANAIKFWSGSVEAYLRATAGVFFRLLDQRGYRLHYAVDNSFDDMQRPFQLFPSWYSACGIVFECPQLLTAQDGSTPAEARHRCTAKLRASGGRFHYVILDTDSEDDSFIAPLEQQEQDKVITILREEAPIPGSQILVYLSGQLLDRNTG